MTVQTSVDASALGFMADRLAKVPAEAKKALRPPLLDAGRSVQGAAKSNASWSSRIPAALRVRVNLAGARMGVTVYAASKVAPHARPYEGMTGRNPFRHPVFGDREVWVAQNARPFLAPAARSKQAEVVDAMSSAIDGALAKAGVTN